MEFPVAPMTGRANHRERVPGVSNLNQAQMPGTTNSLLAHGAISNYLQQQQPTLGAINNRPLPPTPGAIRPNNQRLIPGTISNSNNLPPIPGLLSNHPQVPHGTINSSNPLLIPGAHNKHSNPLLIPGA